MTLGFRTAIHFAPARRNVTAVIRPLARRVLSRRVMQDWWSDEDIVVDPVRPPIDRHWDWANAVIDRDGVVLRSRRVGVVTDDGAVEGAMVLSVQPFESTIEPGRGALFVELLCAAPWNRPNLRRDGKRYFVGVGSELVAYAAHASRAAGHAGRLGLEASPESIPFYAKFGFQPTGADSVPFEGNVYTPMELPTSAVGKVLLDWQGKAING